MFEHSEIKYKCFKYILVLILLNLKNHGLFKLDMNIDVIRTGTIT